MYQFNHIWAAGVIDGRAVVRLRTDSSGAIQAADVYLPCVEDVGKRLVESLGGVYDHKRGAWFLYAPEQEATIKRIMSHMSNKLILNRLRRILLFRATQAGRVSEGVKIIRRKIADESADVYGEVV